MAEPDQVLIAVPFAAEGDKDTIPTNIDPSGNASFAQGWGEDFERDPVTDVNAKRISRGMMNRLMNTITVNLRQYQVASYPVWAKPDANNDKPLDYPYGARVRYSGKVYASIIDGNNDEPTLSDNWVLDDPFDFEAHVASLSEVLAGLINNKIVTPKTFVQAHREQPFSYTKATGQPNALEAKFSPAVERLALGTILYVQAAQSNTGDVTLKVDGLPAYPVLGVGGVQLPAGSLSPNGVMQVIFTGTAFVSPNLSRASEKFYGVTRMASRAETLLGDNPEIASSPKHTSAAVQSGAWTFGTAVFDLTNFDVSISPAPSEIPDGFSISFDFPEAYPEDALISVVGKGAAALYWTSGTKVSSGQIAKGDTIQIIRSGGAWRVVNMLPASSVRLGMLRKATLTELSDESAAGNSAGVTADIFGTAVRATKLRSLSSGLDERLKVSDTVIQAFANAQAQLDQKGGLKLPNIWKALNSFDFGSLAIRAASNASKTIAFNDLDDNPRARLISGSDNLLRFQTFVSGAKKGSDLTYSGERLAEDNDPNRRFINRKEAATIEETAAMQTWEKYVTPAALAALGSGVDLSSIDGNTVYTIGGKLRVIVGNKYARNGYSLQFPSGFFTRVPWATSTTGRAYTDESVTITPNLFIANAREVVSTGDISNQGFTHSFIIIGWCG